MFFTYGKVRTPQRADLTYSALSKRSRIVVLENHAIFPTFLNTLWVPRRCAGTSNMRTSPAGNYKTICGGADDFAQRRPHAKWVWYRYTT